MKIKVDIKITDSECRLVNSSEISTEIEEYKKLCENKNGKYQSFSDMKSQLFKELINYTYDQLENIREICHYSLTKTEKYISSIFPFVAAVAIGIFSILNDMFAWIAFLILVILYWFLLKYYGLSVKKIYAIRYYEIMLHLIEQAERFKKNNFDKQLIEKNRTKNKNRKK